MEDYEQIFGTETEDQIRELLMADVHATNMLGRPVVLFYQRENFGARQGYLIGTEYEGIRLSRRPLGPGKIFPETLRFPYENLRRIIVIGGQRQDLVSLVERGTVQVSLERALEDHNQRRQERRGRLLPDQYLPVT